MAAATAAAATAAPTGVAALHDRQRREAETFKRRETQRTAASQLLREWERRTRGDIYAMLGSLRQFVDLFDDDPLQWVAVQRGSAAALKKVWHRLAARLHPDRQQHRPLATQVLAEEVFKALTLAYAAEKERLGLHA